MKKIIITPGITDLNRGDQALIWLIRDILVESGISASVKLLESGNSKEDIYNQSRQSLERGYDVMTPLLLHPARKNETRDIGYSFLVKVRWGLTSLKDLFYSSLLLFKSDFLTRRAEKKLSKEQQRTYKEFKEMDLLIVKGGGFLHTYNRLTDLYYLYYSLFNLMLATRLDKKVLIMPNSFGPFLGKYEKIIVKKVLNKSKRVYAREDISRRYLQDLLDQEVYLSADLGFYVCPQKSKIEGDEIKLPRDKIKVAITLRPYRFPEYRDSEKRYEKYIQEMYLVTSQLIKKGYHPVFVAHTLGPSAHEDDRIALDGVIQKLKKAGVSTSSYSYVDEPSMDCFDLTQLYSHMDYIIGTRFHSVIFAMISLTPAIAISYSGHKTIGIMEDMGLEEFVVEIGEMDSLELVNKFDSLVAQEDKVKEKIEDYLRKSNQQKKQMISDIKKILDES